MQYLNAVLTTYLEKKRHTYWHIIATGVVDHGNGGGSVGAVVRLNVSYRYTPNCVESGILFFFFSFRSLSATYFKCSRRARVFERVNIPPHYYNM